jgi:uncharacterized protein (DUF58 family)
VLPVQFLFDPGIEFPDCIVGNPQNRNFCLRELKIDQEGDHFFLRHDPIGYFIGPSQAAWQQQDRQQAKKNFHGGKLLKYVLILKIKSPMKELLKKLRRYEIRIRKAINAYMQGNYHSVFKGSGLEFDDVRSYQYGDDVRTIDWNVTAKGHGTYIKTFREEKEQIVFFILDVSASQEIGVPGKQKIDIAREICGVLALSAIKESSQAGLLCFSDQKEKYVKPGKGQRHAYLLFSEIFSLQPASLRTDLRRAILYALEILKRKSVVILISDFIDTGFEPNLRALARKHDLVVIHVSDQRETNLPRLGIVPLYDRESGKTLWMNTSSAAFRNNLTRNFSGKRSELQDLCRRQNANYMLIDTREDYVPRLVRLFKVRNKAGRSVR